MSNHIKHQLALLSYTFFIITILLFPVIPLSPFPTLTPAAAAGTITDSQFVGGLNSPTSMAFSPDGRLFVNEKGGSMKVIKNGILLATPFLTVPVDSSGERGLLGIAFDPNFATNRILYAYYTATTPTIHNRVSHFTADPANLDRVLAGSEVPILDLETLSSATNHNGGAIHFGKDGKLYVAVGNNANNANSQSLATRLGKMLRINSDGTIPTDNPFFNTAGAMKEIWALGLRNPFTFAFSTVNSSLMYINDVGENTWEEVDPGIKGANYGWPICEGFCSNTNFVNPVYAYNHNGSGAAITGAAFYESNQFPSSYFGSYFFGDYVNGFIERMLPNHQVTSFLSGINSPVDITVGPDGSIYYLSIGGGSVHKVQYVASGNHNPVAVASASPTFGAVPLAVTFNGTKSSDPDPGTILSYSWNFGDGSPAAAGAIAMHTYNNAGPYVATLTVMDGAGGSGSTTVNIAVGTSPVGQINTPVVGTHYNAGDTIFFSGTGTDKEDGTLKPSAFQWVILFHHDTHTHPFLQFANVTSGSFTIPRLGETSSNVWYRIYLTVTDSTGLTNLTTRDVLPNKSTVSLTSNITGLQVNLDGIPETTPYSFVGVVGMTRTLQAPDPQAFGGTTYHFAYWSDLGAPTHNINTPASNTIFTEYYGPVAIYAAPQVLTMSNTGTAGGYATLNVAGFAANEKVQTYLDNTPTSVITVGSTGSGSVSQHYGYVGVGGNTAGTHRIAATGLTSGKTATNTIILRLNEPPAIYAAPNILTLSNTGTAGGYATLSVAGFASNEKVQTYLDNTPTSVITVGSTGSGSVSQHYGYVGVGGNTAGTHRIAATGLTSGKTASGTITLQ